MKSKIITGLLCIHFAFIVLGAVVMQFWRIEHPLLEKCLKVYSSWTGGGHGYSFFSPDVGYQNIAKVFILTEQDSLIVEAFGGTKDYLDARISSFIHSSYNLKVFELNARLLSAYIFGVYPDAKVVEISLGKFVVAELKDYRSNPEPSFEEYYKGVYSRIPSER